MRNLVFLLPILLLASCGNVQESSSSSLPSSSSPSSSLDPLEEERESVRAFLEELSAYDQVPRKIEYAGTVSTGFNLSISPIEISGTQTGATAYYENSEVGRLLDTIGNEQIEGSAATSFHEQKYVDGGNIYSLRLDLDTNEKIKQQEKYVPASHDPLFDLSFFAEQRLNLTSYLSLLRTEHIESFSALPIIKGDGDYTLVYNVTLFTYEGYPDQKVSYSYSFSILDGKIVKAKGELTNERFLAGKVHESQHSTREVSYFYSPSPAYEGEIFDPADF